MKKIIIILFVILTSGYCFGQNGIQIPMSSQRTNDTNKIYGSLMVDSLGIFSNIQLKKVSIIPGHSDSALILTNNGKIGFSKINSSSDTLNAALLKGTINKNVNFVDTLIPISSIKTSNIPYTNAYLAWDGTWKIPPDAAGSTFFNGYGLGLTSNTFFIDTNTYTPSLKNIVRKAALNNYYADTGLIFRNSGYNMLSMQFSNSAWKLNMGSDYGITKISFDYGADHPYTYTLISQLEVSSSKIRLTSTNPSNIGSISLVASNTISDWTLQLPNKNSTLATVSDIHDSIVVNNLSGSITNLRSAIAASDSTTAGIRYFGDADALSVISSSGTKLHVNGSSSDFGEPGIYYEMGSSNLDQFTSYIKAYSMGTGSFYLENDWNLGSHGIVKLTGSSTPAIRTFTFGAVGGNVATETYVSSYTATIIPKYGSSIFSGDNTTVTFTVTHGAGFTPAQVIAQTTCDFSIKKITNKTATTFDVTFNSAPTTGTNNITFDWEVKQ